MSDTPIAERLAAELEMPWPPRYDSPGPVHAPEVDPGRLAAWYVTAARTAPMHMDGSIFDDSRGGGALEGCGPLGPAGPHPPNSGKDTDGEAHA